MRLRDETVPFVQQARCSPLWFSWMVCDGILVQPNVSRSESYQCMVARIHVRTEEILMSEKKHKMMEIQTSRMCPIHLCVVRGPELLLGHDIRTWSAIADKFDVVIGGPPCKSFSPVGRWKKASQENLIPEFERIVAEARPTVFVMENVREAPIPHVVGYAIHNYLINAHHYGANQNRIRRFSFGYEHAGGLKIWPFLIELPLPRRQRTPDPFPTVIASEGKFPTNCAGRKIGRRLTIKEMCELQGVPEKVEAWFLLPRGKAKRQIFRKEFQYELIGNAVEMNTGRVIARAVKNALKVLPDTSSQLGAGGNTR